MITIVGCLLLFDLQSPVSSAALLYCIYGIGKTTFRIYVKSCNILKLKNVFVKSVLRHGSHRWQ